MSSQVLVTRIWSRMGSAEQLPKAIGKAAQKNNANSQLGSLWGVGGEGFGPLQIIANLFLFRREKSFTHFQVPDQFFVP